MSIVFSFNRLLQEKVPDCSNRARILHWNLSDQKCFAQALSNCTIKIFTNNKEMTSCLSFAKSSRCKFVSKVLHIFNSQCFGKFVVTQQSVHPTGGSLCVFRHFSGFEFSLLLSRVHGCKWLARRIQEGL